MSRENQSDLSRRAYLAAGAVGMASLAGCPARQGATTETETGVGTADGERSDSGTEAGESNASASAASEVGQSVLTDQVGYLPDDRKVGVVRVNAKQFQVLDDAGEVVAEGECSGSTTHRHSGDTVRQADFSDVTEPGTYQLAVDDGGIRSHPFTIDGGAWGQTLAEVCRGYTLRRSNTDVTDDVTGLDVGPGHSQDAEAKLYFGDQFHDKGEPVDVAGGWYDAGDYGKYVPSASLTVANQMLAYERNPDTFTTGQLAIGAALADGGSGGDLPDLLREVRFELEWLEKMQREDGAVYHKVGGTSWPGIDVPPSEDDQTRYVFGLSTFGTAQFAGAMAMAARVFADHDREFADRALQNAEDAWSYVVGTRRPRFREDEGQNGGSNAYRKEGDAVDRFWAAAELLRTTGEGAYAEYLHGSRGQQFDAAPEPIAWTNTVSLGHWAYYNAEAGADDRKQAIGDALVSYADGVVDQVESDGYNVALTRDEYVWGSNKTCLGKANLLLLADAVETTAAYVDAARDQVHYVLGRTPTAKSYVTGTGENPPKKTHNRIRVATGVNVPGYVVGGANKNGGDPALDGHIEDDDPTAAKSYVDMRSSWSCNETDIQYSAPLVFALAHFAPADAVSVGQ